MTGDYDLIIRNGSIADGTGAELRSADIGIRDGLIAAVGSIAATGRDEIDAGGMIVTPGFVDVHTHYDGQVTWESRIAPSSLHGVTTVVMGNCGVGFAPCRPSERELLIKVMEGVEDIPEAVLSAGIPWSWETFPEYLDWLAERKFDVDIGAQVPHSAVRVYAMGKRGAEREPATPADLAEMNRIVTEAIHAGALGFSTSRTLNHRYKDGRLAPSITAGEDELTAIARGMREIDKGVFQWVDDWTDFEASWAMWERIVAASGRPASFTMSERGQDDAGWEPRMQKLRSANAAGLSIKGQFLCRPIGIMYGYDLSYNPFTYCPTYAELERLPLASRVRELRRPDVRAQLLVEQSDDRNPQFLKLIREFDSIFPLGDPPNYCPAREASIGAAARRAGVSPLALAYDTLLEQDGHAVLYSPITNYGGYSMDHVLMMLRHPDAVFGLGDGGAHCGLICDASATTYMLTYWTRDRSGEKLTIPQAVKKLTSDTAASLGLADRGIVAPGFKADINIIDYDRLNLHGPRITNDLPGGGRRLMQYADGYVATIAAGVVTYRNGEHTGALPGRIIRGAQPAPH